MLPLQGDSGAADDSEHAPDDPDLTLGASKPPPWSSENSPKARSFDEAAFRRPSIRPLPPPIPLDVPHRSETSSSSSSALVLSSSTKPQVMLNMSQIQMQAEILEAETSRDQLEAQRQAERHHEEMLDIKGIFRVPLACEYCRARKAKVNGPRIYRGVVMNKQADRLTSGSIQCSGQQPCQRCTRQGILCEYSKTRRKAVGPWNPLMDKPIHPSSSIPAQFSSASFPSSSRISGTSTTGRHGEGNIGPMRAERSREGRYASMSMPLGLRRNTAPCTAAPDHINPAALQPRQPTTPNHHPPLQTGVFPPLPRPSTSYRYSVGPSHGLPVQAPPSMQPRPLSLRYSSISEPDQRRDSDSIDSFAGQSTLDMQPLQSRPRTDDAPPPLSYTTEPYMYPTGEQYNLALATFTRSPMQEPSSSTAAISSGLASAWPEDSAVISLPQRSSHTLYGPEQAIAGTASHDSLDGRWSLDTNLSQQARYGSLSTEGGEGSLAQSNDQSTAEYNASLLLQEPPQDYPLDDELKDKACC